jgi:two-component system, sensor histidine kinase PdtaS
MEKLLAVLPDRPQHVLIRVGVTTLIMFACGAIQLAIYAYAGFTGFFILLPGIFIAGVTFDRGSGFYATVLGAAVAAYLSPIGDDVRHLVPLALYLLVGIAVAIFSESLRKTLERLVATERSKDLLLRELHHRTKNNMSIMAALLRIQARATTTEETKAALAAAARRVGVMASLADVLRPSDTNNTVALGDYLQEIVSKMEEMRADTAISISLKADRVDVSEHVALPVGIIISELVINSLKHGFPDGRPGKIDIRMWDQGKGEVVVLVADNGAGCGKDAKAGSGTRLTEAMAKQIGGTLTRESGNPGCLARLRFHATASLGAKAA